MTAEERHSDERRFGLAELVDFEMQLATDQDRPYPELVERDRQISLQWHRPPRSHREALARWLAALRENRKTATLGERVARAHATSSWLVFFVLAFVGSGAVLAVLRFTGDHPINVLVVLGVFVFLQLLSVALSVTAFLWSRFSPGFVAYLPLMTLLRGLVSRLVGPKESGRFFARRSLYAGIERWVLFRTVQLGGVAFNIGALATFIVAVALTDLAFAWSTTLQVGADSLHRFCEALALPWHTWLPEAVPTLDLIHATQYFRLEGAYVHAPAGMRLEDAAVAGGWWPFLLMCLLAYGLFPRLVLLASASLGLRRALAALPFDTPEEADVIARLSTPWVHNVHREDPGNVTPLGEGRPPPAAPQPFAGPREVLVVRWRDAELSASSLSERLNRRFGASVEEPITDAGGRDHAEDQVTLARLAASEHPVVVITEPWNAPDRAFKRLLESIRKQGARDRKIYVLLTEGGGDEERAVWAGYLAELGDPYVALGDL